METLLKESPPNKLGDPNTIQWRPSEAVLKGMQVQTFLDLPKLLALGHNAVLMEYRATRVSAGWRVMIKAEVREQPFVAFLTVKYWEDAVEFITWMVGQSNLEMRPDKYPVKKKT